MAPQADTSTFRFLDLSPELRNRVYHFVFEDASDEDLDLFAKPYYHSTAAITVTCSQIRQESFCLYKQAIANFWTSHAFHVTVQGQDLDGIQSWEFRVDGLPNNKAAAALSVWLIGEGHSLRRRIMKVAIRLDEAGNVAFACTLPPTNNDSQENVALTEQGWDGMMTRLMDMETLLSGYLPPYSPKGAQGFAKDHLKFLLNAMQFLADGGFQ